MKDLNGETMLSRVVRRAQRASLAGEVIVATSKNSVDDVIVKECSRLGVAVLRGEENDVLDRYCRAARSLNADAVVRITSDCPLIEPEIVDKVIGAFLQYAPDYASNTLQRSYPRGLDTEVMTWNALESAWREASSTYQRAHVTPYIYEHPECFRLLPVLGQADYSNHRWTVDTQEDLTFVRQIYEGMDSGGNFHWKKLITLLEHEPELVKINQGIAQKALCEG